MKVADKALAVMTADLTRDRLLRGMPFALDHLSAMQRETVLEGASIEHALRSYATRWSARRRAA